MKKLICVILSLLMFSNICFADCDWAQIKKLPDGGYEYSPALNLCVGQLVQTNAVQTQQLQDLGKAIQLKDLALTNSDARVALWQKSSDDELSRLNTIQSDEKHSDWLFFGLGVATTFLAGYTAAKLAGR